MQNLLIVVECRAGAWVAVRAGLDIARRHAACVTLALAVPPLIDLSMGVAGEHALANATLLDDVARECERTLAQAHALAQQLRVTACTVKVDENDLPSRLSQLAREVHAELIVVACEPINAVQRLLTGSLVPGLVTAATVPVMICRDEPPAPPAKRQRSRARRGRQPGEGPASPTLTGL